MKGIPGIGSLVGMLVVPGVAAASTWAVGKVFAWHFEQGGTLANFDVEVARPRFQREFAAARGRAKPAPPTLSPRYGATVGPTAGIASAWQRSFRVSGMAVRSVQASPRSSRNRKHHANCSGLSNF